MCYVFSTNCLLKVRLRLFSIRSYFNIQLPIIILQNSQNSQYSMFLWINLHRYVQRKAVELKVFHSAKSQSWVYGAWGMGSNLRWCIFLWKKLVLQRKNMSEKRTWHKCWKLAKFERMAIGYSSPDLLLDTSHFPWSTIWLLLLFLLRRNA